MYGAVPPVAVKLTAPVELPKQRTFVWDVLDVGFALTVTTVAVLEAEQTEPPEVIKAVTVYEADVETVLEAPDPRLD